MKNIFLAVAIAAVPAVCRAVCPADIVHRQPVSVSVIALDNPLLAPVDTEESVDSRVVLGDGAGGVYVAMASSLDGEDDPAACGGVSFPVRLRIPRRQLQEWGFTGYLAVWKDLIPQIPGHPIQGLIPVGRGEQDAITDKKTVLKILVALTRTSAREAGERLEKSVESLTR